MGKTLTFYPSPASVKAMARNGGGRGTSHRIAQISDRYEAILNAQQLPSLSEAEWNLLRDVSVGEFYETDCPLSGSLSRRISNSFQVCIGVKWGVDCDALIAKLDQMSLAQEIAIIEIIESYWAAIDKASKGL